uniref:hypothetical protein n=1 Tax=Nocardia suismassiliense TaxID=2077092 RepID=UPI003F496BBE
MIEAVAFSDIEADLVEWFTAALTALGDTAVVATHVPNPRPPRLVRVVRTGGVRRDLVVDRPRIAIECWDANEIAAADLARTIRAVLGAAAPTLIGTTWCDRVDDGGLAHLPDPNTGTPRYLITAELHVRGTVL